VYVERPKVRRLVEAAVAEIRAAGVEPAVSDILWLAHLAEQRCQPTRFDPLDDFGMPIPCGRAKLRQLTVAGDIWLRDCAQVWWPRPKHVLMPVLAELYCLSNNHDQDVMMQVWDRRTAGRIIRLWAARNLPVSYHKVARALSLVANNIEHREINDGELVKTREVDPFDWGEELAVLCAVYNKPPQYFEFEISLNQCVKLLNKAAYAMGRPDLVKEDNAKDSAFGKFRLLVRDIIRRGKEKDDDGETDII
jgi:hypothetical protein